MAIDEEYPVLEYLIVVPSMVDKSTTFTLPKTLQAPRLCHLLLGGFGLLIGSRLLTTAVGIVTHCLYVDQPSAYFQPNTLLRWVSFIPQLETLLIDFLFPVPNHDVERHLMCTPFTTHVTLPSLRWFVFRGDSAYLEAFVCRVTAPRLEKFGIRFFKEPAFSVPHLLQFINTAENLWFDSISLPFDGDDVYVRTYFPEEAAMYDLLCIPFP
jgi:hypothetical protein